jgi:hypothetical protein
MGLHFACTSCGSPSVSLPETVEDSAIVACRSCGAAISTWGELKRRATEIIVAEHGAESDSLAGASCDPLEFSIAREAD